MRLSIFKISILLIAIGASGAGVIFSEADRSLQLMSLKQTESDEISMYFEKNDLPVMQGTTNILQKTSFSIVGLSILVIGFYPSPIIEFCKFIISPFFID